MELHQLTHITGDSEGGFLWYYEDLVLQQHNLLHIEEWETVHGPTSVYSKRSFYLHMLYAGVCPIDNVQLSLLVKNLAVSLQHAYMLAGSTYIVVMIISIKRYSNSYEHSKYPNKSPHTIWMWLKYLLKDIAIMLVYSP